MNLKRMAMAAALITLCLFAEAKVKPVVHYNFGKSGNVTYAVAPEKLTPVTGKGELFAIGRPVFYADAPGDKKMKGEGGILFNGNGDGYKLEGAFGSPAENQVLEIWVKPRLDTQQGEKEKELAQVLLSNGTAKEGYVFVHRRGHWYLISGGSGRVEIGEVLPNAWTHLAMVMEEGKGTVWMNGKKTGTFKPTKAIAPHFSIAVSEEGKEAFYGEIYEVRYSTFATGKFNPESDFLLDYKKIKEISKQRLAERRVLVQQLEQASAGKKIVTELPDVRQEKDWLINQVEEPACLFVQKSEDGLTSKFQLNNGLVSRTFYVGENIACVGYKNHSNEAEFLRAVKPEARVCIDSVWYEVGGLKGQPELSYLLDSWYVEMEASDLAFTLEKVETGLPLKRYPWTPKYNAVPTDWPAKGVRMEMTFIPTESMVDVKDIRVKVNYEIYQGLPLIAKWIEVVNEGEEAVLLNDMECEVLAVNQDQVKRIHVESDFSFALVNADIEGSALMHYAGTPKAYHVGSSTTKWTVDKDYNTWASHNQAEDKFLGFPHHNLLLSKLPMGPCTKVSKEVPFKSYITFELLQDSDDRERQSLGHRRMYKKLAPQTTESLISGGITSHDETKLKGFIDQMAELGLEQLDIMAWPGISHDNLDSAYVQLWRRVASYAKERGIVMGGYELQVASRGRGAEVDCIHPETGKPGSLFGQSVCIASKWKDTYYSKMWEFFDKTGLMTYNMDGPYHGDPCASTVHPYHACLEDSQWQQWKTQVEVIHELQRRGMYIPIPDWYFLNGQCSTGMGYREASANLTPQQQLLLGRQYIYDGTWHKIPTMGWMTLQLVGFYTNDPRVGLEPLCDNLDRYESQLMQFLGSGCHLTIRGNRLYDTPETKQMVSRCIDWFKEYRDILTSDIIHVSRPTGRDLDCMMHVNPFIKHKGMVVVFNPTDRDITKEMRLPLYYTGLKGKATVTASDGNKQSFSLNQQSELLLPVSIKAQGVSWFLIEE
ncbi:LamG domain-containing protein [Parabacteroides faecis]|uniref:LamG-like jellyroll fold domain-containing protein n=1 Tax=Parabacteroides TaxID=375288 RepID=UPI000EFE81BD|nr:MULTISPECIES: LamG-like jellyroll fold domain-containing protein [Parabacteroides]MBC8616296.1 LamG domain-containing protein [Parabacteroides faecis]RHR98340.1 LamG domain-containing protein [Parabacteroides sp. AF14-59]